MHKLRFQSSAPVQWSGKGIVSCPALPWSGAWAVIKICSNLDFTQPPLFYSITHVYSGARIATVSNARIGRMICAVLNALPYDWAEWPKFAYEFSETVWFNWLKQFR